MLLCFSLTISISLFVCGCVCLRGYWYRGEKKGSLELVTEQVVALVKMMILWSREPCLILLLYSPLLLFISFSSSFLFLTSLNLSHLLHPHPSPSTILSTLLPILYRNVEFHPMLFRQHEACPYKEFPTFSKVLNGTLYAEFNKPSVLYLLYYYIV